MIPVGGGLNTVRFAPNLLPAPPRVPSTHLAMTHSFALLTNEAMPCAQAAPRGRGGDSSGSGGGGGDSGAERDRDRAAGAGFGVVRPRRGAAAMSRGGGSGGGHRAHTGSLWKRDMGWGDNPNTGLGGASGHRGSAGGTLDG